MNDLDKMARELLCSHCDMESEDHYDEMPVSAAEAESAIRDALLTAPPGWKLVPLEPSEAEIDVAAYSIPAAIPTLAAAKETARKLRAAMLAAAPEVK